ncbi:hypothetical protein SNE40_020587 [Patella caerulea]|uniref:Myb/SANT-like DNA-binding domain-containing protein n=1 Tax=Patella caerulea TaxID=87958 RepID=A0AAN8J4W3_PATCE
MLRRLSKVSTKIQSTSTNLHNHIDMPTTSVAANERQETESTCIEKSIPHFWTDAEERALVHLRLPMEKEFNKGEKAHSTLWGRIKVEMFKLNFDVSVTQMINKWNTLKKKVPQSVRQ